MATSFRRIGGEKRDVHHQDKKILRKEDRHVIAEEFPHEILEQQPAQKKVHTVAPVIEDRDDDCAAQYARADISQTHYVVINHILGELVGGIGANDKDEEEKQWASLNES